MSVQTRVESFLNYVTGSAGGWPSLSNAAIIGGMDYVVQTGSNDVYFIEYNTNIGIVGSYALQTGSYFDVMADYAVSQSYDKCYVYGMAGKKQNPPYLQQSLISSSFAKHNIPVVFEYNGNTSHTYFSQRGQAQFSGSFHLFFETPWYSDDTLLNIVSGSFNKNTFRTILGSSPVSSSLVPIFNTSSFTDNLSHPDFVAKNPTIDSGLQSNSVKFYSYNANSSSYQNEIDSGSLVETFMVHTGSYDGSQSYMGVGKCDFMITPNKIVFFTNREAGKGIKLNKSTGDAWNHIGVKGKTSASGSLIKMYDNTTTQVQDIEVGDVVKSYQPLGMPDESQNYLSYTTTDLSGSTTQGSIVVNVMKTMSYGYYLINGSIRAPYNPNQLNNDVRYFVKKSGTWSWNTADELVVGDYLLDPDGNETEITSITENSGDTTWYAIELIEVGEEVKNYDFETQEVKAGKVLSIETPTHADIIEISFGDKKTKNTFDHPYWVIGKGWSSYKPNWTQKRYEIESEQLEVGDKCLEYFNGELREVEITNLEEVINPVQTYSLEIETNHNYFANDVLVHNKFCFLPDQVINMGEGNYKRIDEIELGESVLVFDEENDEFKEGKVNSIMKKLHDDCYELTLESGQTLKPTGNHPFLLKDKGWSTIDGHNPNHAGGNGVVEVGDYVRDLDGWVEITNIKKIEGEHITYNLLNQDYGTIVAHDIVTHNSLSCFVVGTLITMSDGTYKNIEDIVIGDEVKSFDVENGKFINSIVEKIHSPIHDNIVEYVFENGEKLKGTDDHPIWIKEKGWCSSNTKKTLSDYDIEVNEIELGDEFLNDEFSYNKLVEIRYTNEELQTYNIEKLSNSETYFAGKVLVHNESNT